MFRHLRPTGALRLVPWPALSLLALGLAACDDDQPEEDPGLRLAWVEGRSTAYEVREVWTYASQEDPPQPRGADSLRAVLTLSEEEAGQLYGQPARRIREDTRWYAWDNPFQPVSTSLVDCYYQSREEALLLLAYSGETTLFLDAPGPDPLAPGLRLERRAGRAPLPVAPSGKPARAADELIIEDPPLVVLIYPLEQDLMWTYRQAGMPWRIDKEVTALGDLDPDSTEARECAQLGWHFDLDADGEWDPGLSFSSWLDGEGLVSSDLWQELEVTDEESGEIWSALRTVALRRIIEPVTQGPGTERLP